MPWIENLVAGLVAAHMPGHDLIVMHDVNMIDVAFHRHGLKGTAAGNAVTHVVETGELILVDFRQLPDTGVESILWQCGSVLAIAPELLVDGLLRIACGTRPVLAATLTQVRVELGQILHAGNRSPPTSLQCFHPILDNRFFIASGRHAKQRFEHVVARQCRITRVQSSLAADEQRCRHRLRIVPPDFSWKTFEKIKRLHHAFQNRLGPFRRKSDCKRCVGIRPYQNQDGNLPPTVRKVDVNLAEVRFQSLARFVVQRDKRLAFFGPMLLHEPPNRIVSALVLMFVAQPLEDPHRRVPLLRRC